MGKIDNFGDRRQVGQTEENKGGKFRAGNDPRRNPGGKPSLHNDLKRAAAIGVPPEVTEALDAWFLDAAAKLHELGADGFVAGLRGALDDAVRKIPVLDAAEVRAMWWRSGLMILMDGPQHPTNDPNFRYMHEAIGIRSMGKPKETIAFEDASEKSIDWSRVPKERREPFVAMIAELRSYLDDPAPTEH